MSTVIKKFKSELFCIVKEEAKQNETKQNNTKRKGKVKHNNTYSFVLVNEEMQNQITQNKANHSKTKQSKTTQNKANHSKTKQTIAKQSKP